jgi:hypothetical protein
MIEIRIQPSELARWTQLEVIDQVLAGADLDSQHHYTHGHASTPVATLVTMETPDANTVGHEAVSSSSVGDNSDDGLTAFVCLATLLDGNLNGEWH